MGSIPTWGSISKKEKKVESEFWDDLREDLEDPEFREAYIKESRKIHMRDWLEGQKWYWFSLTFQFNLFPWHWEMEWNYHKSGHLIIKFGPFGMLALW